MDFDFILYFEGFPNWEALVLAPALSNLLLEQAGAFSEKYVVTIIDALSIE